MLLFDSILNKKEVIEMSVNIRLVASAVIFKKTQDGVLILTQVRAQKNRDYDPLYGLTMECVQETLNSSDEPIIQALLRGIEEETAGDIHRIKVFGAGFEMIDQIETVTQEGKDFYISVDPLLVTQTIIGCQPWVAFGFAGEAPADWEPNFDGADGEASSPKWWSPKDLLEDMGSRPSAYMGLCYPLLQKVANHFL